MTAVEKEVEQFAKEDEVIHDEFFDLSHREYLEMGSWVDTSPDP